MALRKRKQLPLPLDTPETEAAAMLKRLVPSKGRPRGKFGAVKTEIHGILFASRAEARYYCHLKLAEDRGEISQLTCHPKYTIKVGNHKICEFSPDFSFVDSAGRFRVQDVKGGDATITQTFRLKAKLLFATQGITVEVIKR